MRALRYVVCDVFTDRPLSGNQLAVFTNSGSLAASTMQALAREMNFSETVFVERAREGGHARIRIFTPTRELPFAGHPTLGSAFVLGQPMQVSAINLETGAGIVPVRLEREGPKVVFGWMVQPLPSHRPFEDEVGLLAALGVPGSSLPVELYDLGPRHVFVALETHAQVAGLEPDMAALRHCCDAGANVFARAGKRVKTRVFAPAHGVAEDAATGSAAGPLAVHLARHGWTRYGEEVVIEQGAEINRPSLLYARAEGGPDGPSSVVVGGSAVVVAHGEFRLPPGI